MNKTDENNALEFFRKEEQDWQLVRQAAQMGDQQAACCFRVMMHIESHLKFLWCQHEEELAKINADSLEHNDNCRLIYENVDELVMLRVKLLYEDFRIQDKRQEIRQKITTYLKTPIQFTHVQNN